MPTTYSSAKQFLGIAKETTQGTAVAATAFIPFDKYEPEDKPVWLDDKAMRGSMVELYGKQQGVLKSDFSLSGPFFGDSIGYLLSNILGDLTVTGASPPYTNVWSTLNTGAGQPVNNTFSHFQGPAASSGTRQYPGSCLDELTLKWNAESQLVTYDAKGTSWPSVVAGATPTATFTAVTPIASWRSTLGIGGPATGGTQVKTVTEGEVSIKRKLLPVYTGQGSQNPYIIQRGTVTVTGKLVFIAADETPLTTMLANTQPQFQWVLDNGVAGAGQVKMTVDCASAAYVTSKYDAGKEAVMYQVDWEAVANTTNAGASAGYSPLKVTVLNAVATGTYQ